MSKGKWIVQPIERVEAGINQCLDGKAYKAELRDGVVYLIDAAGKEYANIRLAGKHYRVTTPNGRFDYYRADSITPIVRGFITYLPF